MIEYRSGYTITVWESADGKIWFSPVLHNGHICRGYRTQTECEQFLWDHGMRKCESFFKMGDAIREFNNCATRADRRNPRRAH